MRLIHQGKVLSEHNTAQISQAGIKNGSFIQVGCAGALKGGSLSSTRIWPSKSVDETANEINVTNQGKFELNYKGINY